MIPVEDLAVGDKIRLAHGGGEKRWWDVRARDERFVILTRQAPFRPKGDVEYTIIDTVRDLRGPCNLIGQGWDFESRPVAESAADLLAALNAHVEWNEFTRRDRAENGTTRWEVPHYQMVEVSYRNNVPVLVTERKAA